MAKILTEEVIKNKIKRDRNWYLVKTISLKNLLELNDRIIYSKYVIERARAELLSR